MRFIKPKYVILFSCLMSIILTCIQIEMIFWYDDMGLMGWISLLIALITYFLITILTIMTIVLVLKGKTERKSEGKQLNRLEKFGHFLLIVSLVLILIVFVVPDFPSHEPLLIASLLLICIGAKEYWWNAGKLSGAFLFGGIVILMFLFLFSTGMIGIGAEDMGEWEEMTPDDESITY